MPIPQQIQPCILSSIQSPVTTAESAPQGNTAPEALGKLLISCRQKCHMVPLCSQERQSQQSSSLLLLPVASLHWLRAEGGFLALSPVHTVLPCLLPGERSAFLPALSILQMGFFFFFNAAICRERSHFPCCLNIVMYNTGRNI